MKRHRKDKEQAEDVSASMKTPRREAFSDFFTTNLKMHLSLTQAQHKLAGTAQPNGPQSYVTLHTLYFKSITWKTLKSYPKSEFEEINLLHK